MSSPIELLDDIFAHGIDIQNNDDLFNLILEQREKINEIIEVLNENRSQN